METQPRLRWSLVVALIAHAGAFAWTGLAARARTERAGLPEEPPRATEMDIEVESPSLTAPAAAIEPAFGPVGRAAAIGTQARSLTTDMPRGSSSNEGAGAPVPSAAPASGGSWEFSPTGGAPSGTQLSSAALDDAVHAGVRLTVSEGKKKSDPLKGVLGGFTEHDIELGFIPGGELVTLTRDTVRASRAPTVGYARFELHIDSAGVLASVEVLDASSERAQWDEVAREITKAARGHVARVPTGARGVALTLEVTSAMKTASGSTPTDRALTRVWRAVNDPLDPVIDGTVPAQRVVAARVVDVRAL